MSGIRNRIGQYLWTLATSIRCSKAGILLGRITSGSGAAEEIELGEGLAFEGGKLKSTVTGGTTDYNDLDNKPTLGAAAALDASEGGNDTADAGKVVKFTSSGSITCSSGILILDGSVSIKDSSSGFTLDLSPASLTDYRTQNLPDKSGTVAMTSDIPETSIGGNGSADSGKVAKYRGDGALAATASFKLLSQNGWEATFNFDPGILMTGDREYYLPDLSGTLLFDTTTTIPNAKSFSGQVEFTGQDLPYGTSGVNRDLGDKRYGKKIYHSAVKVTRSATVGNYTLASVVIPANSLGPNGWLEIRFLITGKTTATAGTRYNSVALGGQTLKQHAPAASTNYLTPQEIVLWNRGSTAVQVANSRTDRPDFVWGQFAGATADGDASQFSIDTTIDRTLTVVNQSVDSADTAFLQSLTVIAYYAP